MRKFKRSEQGSVLLLVLAFAVVVGLLSVVISQRIKAALDTQKDRIVRNQYIELTESLRHQLEDPAMCPRLIGDQAINTGTLSSINTTFGSLNPKPITPGWLSKSGGVMVDSIQLLNVAFVKNVYMANDGATYQVYRGNIFLNTSNVHINVTGPGGRNDLLINLLFMVQNNVIKGCFGETSQGGQCVAMGGAFDWRNATGNYKYPQYRCHPQKVCRYTVTGIFSAANESAANGYCPFPYRASAVGTFIDTGEGRWFCQWCNSFYHD